MVRFKLTVEEKYVGRGLEICVGVRMFFSLETKNNEERWAVEIRKNVNKNPLIKSTREKLRTHSL